MIWTESRVNNTLLEVNTLYLEGGYRNIKRANKLAKKLIKIGVNPIYIRNYPKEGDNEVNYADTITYDRGSIRTGG